MERKSTIRPLRARSAYLNRPHSGISLLGSVRRRGEGGKHYRDTTALWTPCPSLPTRLSELKRHRVSVCYTEDLR